MGSKGLNWFSVPHLRHLISMGFTIAPGSFLNRSALQWPHLVDSKMILDA
ncbi:hypothetical protein PsAD5_02161 [Pseudovibrio sp. Ad5]|nr:hypothetical protein PsAD5_02161 [Pseudovibrio sp. Ad5]